jgi:hypothetical protein
MRDKKGNYRTFIVEGNFFHRTIFCEVILFSNSWIFHFLWYAWTIDKDHFVGQHLLWKTKSSFTISLIFLYFWQFQFCSVYWLKMKAIALVLLYFLVSAYAKGKIILLVWGFIQKWRQSYLLRYFEPPSFFTWRLN